MIYALVDISRVQGKGLCARKQAMGTLLHEAADGHHRSISMEPLLLNDNDGPDCLLGCIYIYKITEQYFYTRFLFCSTIIFGGKSITAA